MPGKAAAIAAAVEKTDIEEKPSNTALPKGPQENEIAVAAYYLWENRGCPIGSDQDDWFRAEEELKNAQRSD
jgi:hypothetical protein